MRRKIISLLMGFMSLAGLTSAPFAHADYVLTAPPREDPASGQAVYGPLAEHLSSLLGEKVVYQHPGDWRSYERKMRDGAYDIIFDGPHFAAWRIEKGIAHPLVKLPGRLDFVVAVRADQPELRDVQSLIGKRVCVLPSPNLTAMTAYSMFQNPMRQPQFIPVRGGMPQLAEKVANGDCVAGVLRTSFYEKKLNDAQRQALRVLVRSQPLTNQGITVSNRLDAAARQKMASALLTDDGRKAAGSLLSRFGSTEKGFEPASQDDYAGQNLLKQNMLFGW